MKKEGGKNLRGSLDPRQAQPTLSETKRRCPATLQQFYKSLSLRKAAKAMQLPSQDFVFWGLQLCSKTLMHKMETE